MVLHLTYDISQFLAWNLWKCITRI